MPWGEDGGCLNIIRTGICNICKRTVLLQKLLLFFIRVIPICHMSVPLCVLYSVNTFILHNTFRRQRPGCTSLLGRIGGKAAAIGGQMGQEVLLERQG